MFDIVINAFIRVWSKIITSVVNTLDEHHLIILITTIAIVFYFYAC